MIDKRDTTLNLNEGVYLNHLKESMPGRQHKPIVEEEMLTEDPIVIMGVAVAAYAVAAFSTAVAGIAARTYKKHLTAAGMECKKAGGDYQACMAKAHMKAEVAKLAVLNQAKGKCDKTKDPAKCVVKLSAMIVAQQNKITRLKHKAAKGNRTSTGQGSMAR